MDQTRKSGFVKAHATHAPNPTGPKALARAIFDDTKVHKHAFLHYKQSIQKSKSADDSQLSLWDTSTKEAFYLSILDDPKATQSQKFSVAKELIKSRGADVYNQAYVHLFSFTTKDEFDSDYVAAATILLTSPKLGDRQSIVRVLIGQSKKQKGFPKQVGVLLANIATDPNQEAALRFDAVKTLLDFSKGSKEKALDALESIAIDVNITPLSLRLDAARTIRQVGGEARRTNAARAYFSIAQIPSSTSNLSAKLAAARVVAEIADPIEQAQGVDILLSIAASKALGKYRLEAAQHAYSRGDKDAQKKALDIILLLAKPSVEAKASPTNINRPLKGGRRPQSQGSDFKLCLNASSFLINKTDDIHRLEGLNAVLSVAQSTTASFQDRLSALDILVSNKAFRSEIPGLIGALSKATASLPGDQVKIAQLILNSEVEEQKRVALNSLEAILRDKKSNVSQRLVSGDEILKHGNESLQKEALEILLEIACNPEEAALDRKAAAQILRESGVPSSADKAFQAFIAIASDSNVGIGNRFDAVKDALSIHEALAGEALFNAYCAIAQAPSSSGTLPAIEHRIIAYRQALNVEGISTQDQLSLLDDLTLIAKGSDLDGSIINDPEVQFQAFMLLVDSLCDVKASKVLAQDILAETSSTKLKNYLRHFIETIEQPEKETVGMLPSDGYLWPDVSSLVFVEALNDAAKTELYIDGETGKKYVMKRCGEAIPEEQIRSEFIAGRAYESLGVRVPMSALYKIDGVRSELFLLTEYFEDAVSLGDYMKEASSKEQEAMIAKIQKGFAMDALLGNWNVLGEHKENIVIHNGEPIRINVGESLKFQAMGEAKKSVKPLSTRSREEIDGFSKYPMDFWAMRGHEIGDQTTGYSFGETYPYMEEFFGGLDMFSLADQIIEIDRRKHVLMSSMPVDAGDVNESNTLKRVIGLRLYYMRELAEQAKKMQADNWSSTYTDSMLMHRMGLRQSQVKKLMPENLVQAHNYDVRPFESTNPFDTIHGEMGTFGGMRDAEGASDYLNAYIKQYVKSGDGDFNFNKLMMEQGKSSFSPMSMAYKYFLFKQQKDQPYESYFWNGKSEAEMASVYEDVLQSEGITEEQFGIVIQAGHAFTQELFRKTQFRYNNQSAKTIHLIRNIPLSIYQNIDGGPLMAYKEDGSSVSIDEGFSGPIPDAYLLPKVAVFDSSSIFRPFFSDFKEGEYGGTHFVEMTVDYHRVLGCYLSQKINKDDSENEFIVMSSGVPMENITSQDDYIQYRLDEDATDMVTHEFFPRKQPKKLE